MKLTTKLLRKLIKEAMNESKNPLRQTPEDEAVYQNQLKKARERDADPEKKAARKKQVDDFFSLGKKEAYDPTSDEPYGGDVERRSLAKWGKPSKPTHGGYEDSRSPEEKDQARMEGMVAATRSILDMFPGGLMVDQKTYNAIEQLAPELLDRVSVSQSRRRE